MGSFRFRKKTDYGLVMLRLLCRYEGKYLSVSKMEKGGLPRSFLVKIAQELIEAGIIGSKEGRGGGYYLTCDPKKTSVKQVVEVLEGDVGVTSCAVDGEECPLEKECEQVRVMKKMTGEIGQVLEKYKINDLC